MFTIGITGLVAVCDKCGRAEPATRDGEGRCLLPDGWSRIKQEEVGTLYYVQIVRSTTICEKCNAEWNGEV